MINDAGNVFEEGMEGSWSYKHSAPLEPGRDRDGPTNIRLRWSREGIESPTNIRLRWSREGIETILRTFGSAGAGKGSRRSYKHSAPLEPGRDRESYKHSAPLEPGRHRDDPTNIRLRWSREGVERSGSYKHSVRWSREGVESPTNIRLRWSREGVEGSGCYSSTCARLQRSGKLSRRSRDEQAHPLCHPALKYRAKVTPP